MTAAGRLECSRGGRSGARGRRMLGGATRSTAESGESADCYDSHSGELSPREDVPEIASAPGSGDAREKSHAEFRRWHVNTGR